MIRTGLGGGQASLRALDTATGIDQTDAGNGQARLGLVDRSLRLIVLRLSPIELGLGDRAVLVQAHGAREFHPGQRGARLCRDEIGARLVDLCFRAAGQGQGLGHSALGLTQACVDRMLSERELRVGSRERSFRGLQIGLGRVIAHGRVAVVELDQHVPGVDRLVVAHQDVEHLTRDARGDVGDVALHERVVGGFLALAV